MAHTGWLIVKFIGDESVSEVPSDWVVGGGVCYWPPYKPSHITVAIKNCELRDESWEKLEVSVFPGGICYDYATARAKARKAEETSDLQSDMEATKRKIIRKRYSSSEESGPDNAPLKSSSPPTSLLPPPPKMRKPVIRSDETASPSTSPGSQGSFSGATSQVENIDAGPSGGSSNATDGYLKYIIEQNRTIMQQNNLLKTLLLETMERVKTLENQSAAPVVSIKQSFLAKFQNLQFPINSLEKVKQLEEIFENENNFQDAVNEFANYGGANIYDFTKRVLSSIITNDVALMFSWLGRQAKEPFHKLKLAQVVIGSAERGKVMANRKEAELSIQKWLKRACDRKTAN